MKALASSALGLLIGLTACSLAPAYKTPEGVPAASSYQELGGWKPAQPLDNQSRGTWWSVFQDPQLDAMEQKAGDANQELKGAIARLEQARAATRIVRADLFPTLTAGAPRQRARSRTSVNSYLRRLPARSHAGRQ